MTTVTLALAVPLSLHHHNDVDPCPTKAFLRKEDASSSSCVSFSCATSVVSVYTAATRQHSQVAFATTTPPNTTTVYIETSVGSHDNAVVSPLQLHPAQDSESSASISQSNRREQTSPSTSEVVASSVEDKVSNASSPLVSLPCDVVSQFIEICSQWGAEAHGVEPPVEKANSAVESDSATSPSVPRVLPRVPQCIVDALPMIKYAAGFDSPASASSSSGLPLSGTEQQRDDTHAARTTSTNESSVAAASFFSQCVVTDVAVFRGGFVPAPASSPKGAVVRATVTSLSDAVRPLWPRVASAFTATVATAVRHRSEMIRVRSTNATTGDENHNEESGNTLARHDGAVVEVAQQQNVDKSSDFTIGENASVNMTETQRRCFPLPCNTVGIVLRRDEVAVWLHDVATKPSSIATTTATTASSQITSVGNGGSMGAAGQHSSVVVASNTAGHLCLGSGSSTATDAPAINGGGGGGGGALPASAALSPPTTNTSHNGRGQHSTSSSGSHPSYGLSGQPSGNFSHASGHLSGHPSGHPSGVASTASFQGSGDVSPTHALPISMNAGGLAALTSPLSAPSGESHSAPLSGSGGGTTGPLPGTASAHGYHMLPTPALTVSAPSGTFSAGNNSSDQLSQWALCKACCYTPSVDVKDAVKTLLLAISADASSEKRPANETAKPVPNIDDANIDEGGVKKEGEPAKTTADNGKVDVSEEKTGVLDATSLSVVMRTTAPTRSSRGAPRPAPPPQQPPVGETGQHRARDNVATAATARSEPASGQEGHRSQEGQGQETPEHQRQGSYHHHPYSPEKQQLVAQAQREEAMRQDRARMDRHRQTEGHEQQYPRPAHSPGCDPQSYHGQDHSSPDHRGHGRYGSTGLPHPHPRLTGGRHALGFDDQAPGAQRSQPRGDERQRYYDHDFSAGRERQWSDQQAHRRAVSDYEYDGQRALSDMEFSGHRGHDRVGSAGGHHRDHSWSGECHQRQSSLGFMGPHPPHQHQQQQQRQQVQQGYQSHRREGSDLDLMSASANTPPVGPYAGAPYPQQHRPIGHGPSASAQAIALLAAGASPNGPSGPTGRVPISPPPASLRPASGGLGSHPHHSPPIDGAGATRGSHERHVSGGAAAGHRRQGSHGSAVSGYRYDPYGATHNRVASDMLMDDDCSPADRETALVTGNANITSSASATAAAAASVGSNARCESRGSIAERVTPRGHLHNTPPSILRQAFGSGDRSGEHERDQETSPAAANPHARPESRSNRNTATGNGDTAALELETTTNAGRRSHRRQVSAPPVIMPHPHDRINTSSAAALSETRKGFAPPQVLSAGSVPTNANGTDSSGGVNGSDHQSTSQQQQRSPQERSAARGHGRQVSFGDDLHHRHTPSPQQTVADSQGASYSEGQHVRHTHRHQLSNASATSNTSAIGALSRAFAGPSPNSQNHPSTCQAAAESHLGGQWEGGEFTADDRLQFRRGSQDSRQEMQDRQDRDRHARTLSEQFLKVHSRQMSRSDAAMNAFDIDPSRVFGVPAATTALAHQDTAATSSSVAQPSPQPHQLQHQQNSQPPHDPSQVHGQGHPHGPGPQYQNQFPQPHQHHHQHHQHHAFQQQQPQQQHQRPVGQIPPHLNQGIQQQGLLGRTAGVAVQQQQQQLPSSLLQQHQHQQQVNVSALRVAAPSYSPPVKPVAASVASVSSIPISPMASVSTIPTNAGVSVTVGTGNAAGSGVGDVDGGEPVKKKKKVKRGCRAGRQVKERKAMKEEEGEEATAAGECLASRE